MILYKLNFLRILGILVTRVGKHIVGENNAFPAISFQKQDHFVSKLKIAKQ